MIYEYLTVFCASIGFYFLAQLVSIGCFYFLDSINGGNEYNVSMKKVWQLTIGSIVPFVLTYFLYVRAIDLTGFVGTVIVFLLLALLLMSVNLQSYALFLRKDEQILRQKNEKDEKFEFLKGLY